MKIKNFRLFVISFLITAILIVIKFVFHRLGIEIIELGSLHSSVITGTFFVIGFLLSTTMSDYKESERIPSEFSSVIENMYEDGYSIYKNYPKFDFETYKKQLERVASSFGTDVRHRKETTNLQIHKLSDSFAQMEKVGVPPNFITKLKQQQAQLTKSLLRVNYIQKITFIPSATILAYSIVILAISLLIFTEIEPFIGGMLITAGISFILIYILQLIQIIKTPFHVEGKTQDDVSLFLIDKTVQHLKKRK